MLAPTPYVDDDPSATILIGRPLTRRCAVRGSGKSKRTWSAATVQAAEWGAAGVADDGVADDGVADDGTGCATGVATAPGTNTSGAGCPGTAVMTAPAGRGRDRISPVRRSRQVTSTVIVVCASRTSFSWLRLIGTLTKLTMVPSSSVSASQSAPTTR